MLNALLLVVVLGGSTLFQDAAVKPNKQFNLVTLIGTTSLDGPVDKGGFDAKYKVGSYFLPTLSLCGNQVANITIMWSKEHDLKILKSTVTATRTLFHVGVPSVPGFLELLYQVDSARNEVTVRMLYIDDNARLTWPELTPALAPLKIDHFGERLKDAIVCTQK
jgi:hypothetical protein